MENENPGDNATPPVATVETPDPTNPPTGSEPDNNPGQTNMVPSDRLREETEKRRRAESENEQLRADLEASKQTPAAQDEGVDPDPETEKLLDSYVRKRGFVSKADLDAQEMKIRVQQDVKDLESNPPNPGIAYNHQEVLTYANENNLPVTSKAALRAAYREMNYDKIVETERQKAIDGFKNGASGGAESPGSQGALPPEEPKLTGRTPKERTRERIRLARQKLN